MRNSGPLFSGLDLEAREVALCAGTDPQRDAARGIAALEVIHDEARLSRAVNVKLGLGAFDRNPNAGPHADFQVDVAFVFLRRLLTGLRKAEVRMRTVLCRVVAAHLILSAPVGGPQVDVLKLAVVHSECDPDETTGARDRITGGTSRQFQFNLSVVKRRAFYNRVSLAVRNLTVLHDFYGTFPHVIDLLQFDQIGRAH